jgi:SpoVK/Ycf46/Vps4 family AAA+-type ATPase
VIAATNRPEDCDPALLRRFAIRVLIGLPTHRDRTRIMHRLLEDIEHNITIKQLKDLSRSMEGWSGSDLESVTREAVMAPVRECLRSAAITKMKARKQNITKNNKRLYNIEKSDERARNELLNSFKRLRPVGIQDFEEAISFWIGDGHGQISSQMAETCGSCHYDSDSTIEDNM